MTIAGKFIGWQAEQTTGNIIDVLSDACRAVSDSNIVGIIGPGLSREASIIAPFGEKIGIPIISYSATDPGLSNRNTYPNFYRTVSSDNVAALALVKLFIRFNWTSCTIIYQNDVFGSGGTKVISDAFNTSGLIVRQMVAFDITTLSIRGDLQSLLTNVATRIIVLWAERIYTSLILQKALDLNLIGPYFTWILSTSISLNSFNQTFHENLIGMLAIEPVVGSFVDKSINETLLNEAYSIWQQYEPESFPESLNVDYYGLFAFDATWTLIQALQQLCTSKINISSSCLSFIGSSFCFDHRFIHSKLLLDAVSGTEFFGVSGPIQFSVNGTDRIIEYAHPDNWRIPNKENVIIWPGNTLTKPTGRAILKGVNLRIGIIESVPFTIVQQTINASESSTIPYSGFVPDLIEMLRSKMEFIPTIELVRSNLTYTEFVQSVSNGVYDIGIGDVTVTAARRELVDFSNAIFDNSLRIIIRKTPQTSIDLFSFLKTFSRNLWLLVLGTVIFAGILMGGPLTLILN
ncbi:unnamed protein product [Rotaria sordida]|nr:unnamed protein product [Rotaria sordida]